MNLLLIGCGNIGGALLNTWESLNLFSSIVVVQPSLSSLHAYNNASITFVNNINTIPKNFIEDLTVLAIKPQNIDQIMPELRKRTHSSIIISLLAGIQLEQISSMMQVNSKIIRIMPNVAIKTGQSLNLAFAQNLTAHDISIIEDIFRPSGLMIWVNEEKHLDRLTAISGSGPAYFFLLAETLVAETIKLGINESTARKLIQQVFIGSASLVTNNNAFGSLINSVASKKGVTEAALKTMTPNIKQVMQEALKAAIARLKELSDENCR